MKKLFLLVMILMLPLSAWAERSPAVEEAKAQALMMDKDFLIKRIVITGLVLRDKELLTKTIIKPNQNKRLSQEQIQGIIDNIKELYVEAGYVNLVDITYAVKKRVLTIHVDLQGANT